MNSNFHVLLPIASSPHQPIRTSITWSNPFPGPIGEVFEEVRRTPINTDLSRMMLVAWITLLTRGQAVALWPNGLPLHVGAHTLFVGLSGCGKSLLRRYFFDPVSDYLDSRTPTSDKQPDFLEEDATRESCIQGLAIWPIRQMMLEEGGMIMSLWKQKSALATFAKLMDGSMLPRSRVSTGRVSLKDYAFSIASFVQPDVWSELKGVVGRQSGGVGTQNRMLFGHGGRPLSMDVLNKVALPQVTHQLISSLGHQHIEASILLAEQGLQHRHKKRMSPEALAYFLDVISKFQPAGSAPEYLSRHAERSLALGGAMSVIVDGPASDISLECIYSAAMIDGMSITAYLQMIYEPPKPTQAELDAKTIADAIRRCVQSTGLFPTLKELKKYAPNFGLTPTRVSRALALLGEHGRVEIFTHEDGDRVALNDPFLGWI